MAKNIEAHGRTVEEAVNKGLAELGLTRDQVDIELLNEGSRGLFGLGGADVAVRITAREEPEPAPMIPPNAPVAEITPEVATPAPTSKDNASAVGKEVLENLLRGMGLNSTVAIRVGAGDDGPDFVLDIVGADLGVLIGRRGETLRDIEYIARLMVAQQVHHTVRFALDVEGYRARRERQLIELAKRMADRVRQSRKPMPLEAMPPNERRIIHLTLREHPAVKTESTGEGDHRRVVILPK